MQKINKSFIIISILFLVIGGLSLYLMFFGINGTQWLHTMEEIAQLDKFGIYDSNKTLLIELQHKYWYYSVAESFGIVGTLVTFVSFIGYTLWFFCRDD